MSNIADCYPRERDPVILAMIPARIEAYRDHIAEQVHLLDPDAGVYCTVPLPWPFKPAIHAEYVADNVVEALESLKREIRMRRAPPVKRAIPTDWI